MQYRLMIYQSPTNLQPSTVIDINPKITQLAFTTDVMGGFKGLTVGLRTDPSSPFGYLTEPAEVPRFAHVVLTAGGETLFEGRAMTPDRDGGQLRGFSAVGYGISALLDDWYASTNTAVTTAGVILTEILSTKAPLIAATVTNSGIAHTRAQFDGLSPLICVQKLAVEGGSNTLYDWLVWSGRQGTFAPRTMPASYPDASVAVGSRYWVDFDEDVTAWKEDDTEAASRVTVEYQSTTIDTTWVPGAQRSGDDGHTDGGTGASSFTTPSGGFTAADVGGSVTFFCNPASSGGTFAGTTTPYVINSVFDPITAVLVGGTTLGIADMLTWTLTQPSTPVLVTSTSTVRTTEAVSTTWPSSAPTRRVLIKGSQTSVAEANAYAATYLAAHEQPVITATLVRHAGKGLRLATGGEMPSHLVRAGEWVQVGTEPPCRILSTTFDCNTEEWSATLQNRSKSFESNIQAFLALQRLYSLRVNGNDFSPL